ncbi:MAG: DUF2461 family protein [Chloroflexi bacterium]|nr:DUF2461 family protein [Chloroflexota bacterium]
MAINRDTRFSPDKTPYKTHLDLWFWHAEGAGLSRERPGYFVRIEEQRLILGAGMHAFSAEGVLDRYRQAVLDPARGAQLEAAAHEVGTEHVKGRIYSRVVRGLPPELFSERLPELCLRSFQKNRPLLQWLVDLLPG